MGTLGIITETKVTRRIDLGDYEECWRGAVFDVWVAPPRAHLNAFDQNADWIREQIIEQEDELELEQLEPLYDEMYLRIDSWLAETWTNFPTQPDEYTALEEVAMVRGHLQDVDPDAWVWLRDETHRVIKEYRGRRAKN